MELTEAVATGMTEDLMTELRSVPILSSLKDEELRCLGGLKVVKMHAGDFVIRQGESQRYFWILLEGELRLTQNLSSGREITHHVYTAGATFGELSLLANIPPTNNIRADGPARLLQLNEDGFWELMTSCPDVRKAILQNMAFRFQKMQSMTLQQEKMASLGTLAAGLMHELNNPGAAARRAASQLRENLLRLHELSTKFSERKLSGDQKQCMHDLQKLALSNNAPPRLNSIEQSDAEEALAEWMSEARVADAWKLAPTLVGIGFGPEHLSCARAELDPESFEDALRWLDALVSSFQLVTTIEESIGRVTDLVHAVKSYAYEGKGQRMTMDVNESIHATLVILGHKIRGKQIVLEKNLSADLPLLQSECSGLNQIWTNLLDNAIDAVPDGGRIRVETWSERDGKQPAGTPELCIRISDNGAGIPIESQKLVFDPFYTTKEVGVGTGLGLGIVQRIVEQYGGNIRFSSIPGETQFLVRIPANRS